jgi:hypothetical protein
MTKFLIAFVASVSVVACMPSPDDPMPTADDHTVTVDGRTFSIEEGPGIDQPAASVLQSSFIEPRCRVVLDYCSDPSTGGPSCHFTNCSVQRAVSACLSLVSSTCG